MLSAEGEESGELTVAPLTPTAPPLSPQPPQSPPSPPPATTIPLPPSPPTPMTVDAGRPTIFGQVVERAVTFCLDTSGSMHGCLSVIKEQLMEALMAHARRPGDRAFNIVEFNSGVRQWSDTLVACTPQTVGVAGEWVAGLGATGGTNTQAALLTALTDPQCQAVILVTDSPPDHFPEDVLDQVVAASTGRPIHCVYLAHGDPDPDPAAVDFLEDLAAETFGSLHIAALTPHGAVESVTPLYRADHGLGGYGGGVVRTVDNKLLPNLRQCSVATTLQIDPDDILSRGPLAPPYAPLAPEFAPLSPLAPQPWWGWRYWGLGVFPYRYYFPHSWARYRPAKAWLRDQQTLETDAAGLSPAAGALLIGKQVLARRVADGYFYLGSVQSQLLEDKFLVAFGPCKHGKFRETSYQDTFIFDIVDYCDAQRHTIITGDHVLAPWEPEGERYGPGIVIDGQEKRQAVGPEDHQLTVAFSNGRTEKVAAQRALWVPPPIYERVALELKMPADTRAAVMATDHYPLRSLPGYPTSGPTAVPPELYRAGRLGLEPHPAHGGWDVGYYPPYPLVLRRKQERQAESEVGEGGEEEVIPGTDMTRRQLEERVSVQLSEFQSFQHASAPTSSRLLGRRQKQEENTLKKSVSFRDHDLVHTAPDTEVKVMSDAPVDGDSGFASSPEPDSDDREVREEADRLEAEKHWIAEQRRRLHEEWRLLEAEEAKLADSKSDLDLDPRLTFYRSPGVGRRPPWQYWRNDPSPPVPTSPRAARGGGGGGGGGGGHGPFRETALQAPLEARDQRRSPYIVEWTSPNFKYVDTFAKADRSRTVEECLHPHPPAPSSGDGSYSVAPAPPPTEDEKQEARREYRRRRYTERQRAWVERLQNEDHMAALMRDQHRERQQAHIDRQQQRQEEERETIARAREAKKRVSKELRERIEAGEKRDKERQEQRLNAMRQRRERREALDTQRQKEIEETRQRREDIKRQHSLARHNAATVRLEEEEARTASVETQHRGAKLHRLHHFHRLEDAAQAKKDLRVAVSDQHLALYRSQIFP